MEPIITLYKSLKQVLKPLSLAVLLLLLALLYYFRINTDLFQSVSGNFYSFIENITNTIFLFLNHHRSNIDFSAIHNNGDFRFLKLSTITYIYFLLFIHLKGRKLIFTGVGFVFWIVLVNLLKTLFIGLEWEACHENIFLDYRALYKVMLFIYPLVFLWKYFLVFYKDFKFDIRKITLWLTVLLIGFNLYQFLITIGNRHSILSLLMRTILSLSSEILTYFGYDNYVDGNYIRNDYTNIFLGIQCTGKNITYVFMAVVFISKAKIWSKILFSLIGAFIIFLLNCYRVTLLFVYVTEKGILTRFDAFHSLYGFVIYLFIMAMWLYWFRLQKVRSLSSLKVKKLLI